MAEVFEDLWKIQILSTNKAVAEVFEDRDLLRSGGGFFELTFLSAVAASVHMPEAGHLNFT